jgi:dihydroneopterin aldolase
MDKIYLNQMHFYGYHGVYEEENKLGQAFLVDLELLGSFKEAARTDDVSKTINYEEVYDLVRTEVEETRVKLIETLAYQIATKLLQKFTFHEVKVKVTKPNPPLPGHFHSIAVKIIGRARDQSVS